MKIHDTASKSAESPDGNTSIEGGYLRRGRYINHERGT